MKLWHLYVGILAGGFVVACSSAHPRTRGGTDNSGGGGEGGTNTTSSSSSSGSETSSSSSSSGSGSSSSSSGSTSSSSSSSSSSSASSASSASSSAGQPTCDKQTVGDCNACQDCVTAPGKLCEKPFNDCNNSSECIDYYSCATNCPQGDQACIGDCQAQYATGFSLFQAFAFCVVCDGCPLNCDAGQFNCP